MPHPICIDKSILGDVVDGRICTADGSVRKIERGRVCLEDGSVKDIMFGTPINELPVGTIVRLGSVQESYRIVHQGNPNPSMYNVSGSDTWLWRRSRTKIMNFDSENNDFENSDILAYLNDEQNGFLSTLSPELRAIIREVRIPYMQGKFTAGTIKSGNDGLLTRVFLLSCNEIGIDYANQSDSDKAFKNIGAKLDYFPYAEEENEAARRIRKAESMSAVDFYGWWTRHPYNHDSGVYHVNYEGYTHGNFVDTSSYKIGAVPAFVVDGDTLVDENNYIIT